MSREKHKGTKSYLPFVIIGVVLLGVVAAAAALMLRPGGGHANTATKEPAAPRVAGLPGAQPPHFRGNEGAGVVLEEFGDYQCPPCGLLHPILQRIESDYHSRIKFVFRHYPLQQIHKNAYIAARAAESAGAQDRFWEMHDMIYEHQDEWKDSPDPRPIFLGYARRLGLDDRRLDADIDSPAIGGRVRADYERGTSLGVTGTPSVFLNGRVLPASKFTYDKLREEIEAALAGTSQ